MRSRNCCCYAHNATNSRSSHYCNWQSTFLVKLQQSKLTPEVNTGMVFRHPHKAYVVHIYIYIYAHTHTHTHTPHIAGTPMSSPPTPPSLRGGTNSPARPSTPRATPAQASLLLRPDGGCLAPTWSSLLDGKAQVVALFGNSCHVHIIVINLCA